MYRTILNVTPISSGISTINHHRREAHAYIYITPHSPLVCPLLFGTCANIKFTDFFRLLVLLIENSNHTGIMHSSMFLFMPLSLAKATLVLIPLLGIHEVVFTLLVDECVEGSIRYAKNFINLTLSSIQVTPVK